MRNRNKGYVDRINRGGPQGRQRKPGEGTAAELSYTLDFQVRDQSGEEHINLNYRDFRFDRLKNITIVQQARFMPPGLICTVSACP